MQKRLGEYADRGDYHERMDPTWKYLPVYLAKRKRVEQFLADYRSARIIDLGCGEGVLVKNFRERGYNIIGMDLHYESDYVRRGSILETGLPDGDYDLVLCLDVIEHLDFADQERAVSEIARLLRPGGKLLLTTPNLAHLASRLSFLVRGKLIRTSTINRHSGDRPLNEYRDILQEHFVIRSCEGIFPTFPLISLLTVWKPARSVPLHNVYNRLLAYPGWCFLNVFVCEKKQSEPRPADCMNEQAPKPKANTNRMMILRILGTVLSLGLLVYLVWAQGWNEFVENLRSLPFQSFLLALGLMLCSRIFVTLRWFALLRSAKAPVRFGQCLRLTFMGLFASNFLPSTVGGDLIRMAGAVYLRLDAAMSAASLLVDRLTGMLGMALFAPVGLVAMMHPTSAGAVLGGQLPQAAVSIPGLLWLWERGIAFLRSLLHSSIYWLKHPSSLGLALLCTFGHMLFTFLAIWVVLTGMGQPVSLLWIGGLWSLSYFVSLLPVSINGFGLQEVSISYLYSHFAGISMQSSLALAVLMRMLFMLASLPGVLFLSDILRPIPALPKVDASLSTDSAPSSDDQ